MTTGFFLDIGHSLPVLSEPESRRPDFDHDRAQHQTPLPIVYGVSRNTDALGAEVFDAALREARRCGLSSRWRHKDKDARPRAFEHGSGMKLTVFIQLFFGARRLAFGCAAALIALSPALVEAEPLGSATGLPLPRYASLKTDRVNLREGPSKDHATKWVFQRAGLPVEITAEFETWRKVRDSEGAEGWVLHSLLSGRRTGLVGVGKAGQTFKIYVQPRANADVAATLQSGVIANVRSCDGAWCLIFGDGYKGYIEQVALWGVYPDETIQ
jgi:SH3-like domain-containing protein